MSRDYLIVALSHNAKLHEILFNYKKPRKTGLKRDEIFLKNEDVVGIKQTIITEEFSVNQSHKIT